MVSTKRSRSAVLAGGVPSLEEVYPVWFEASPDERCAYPTFPSSTLTLLVRSLMLSHVPATAMQTRCEDRFE